MGAPFRSGSGVLIGSLLLAACSATAPPSVPTAPPTVPPAPTSTSPTPNPTTPTATPTRTPTATQAPSPPATPSFRMPLAMAMHITRVPADVDPAAARAAAAGRGSRWSDVGQSGGRMRVLTSRNGSPDELLRQVRERTDTLAVVPADAVDERVRVLTVGGRHPLRDPAGYPLNAPSRRPEPEVTTLTAVGDVMLARRVGARMRAEDDYAYPMRPLARRLAAAEITVGNFESTLSRDGSPTQGTDSFGADSRAVQALRLAGFDLVSLANNHVGDYGQRALRQTLDRFAQGDVATVGAGRNASEARRPLVLERTVSVSASWLPTRSGRRRRPVRIGPARTG